MKLISILVFAALATTGCGQGQPDNFQASSRAVSRHQIQSGSGSAAQPVLGVISNEHGVWDDVDQFITARYTDPEKAKAMRQLAIAIQNALINNDTREKGQEGSRAWFRAFACLKQKLGEAWYYESKLLTAEMLNSEERSRAYAIQDSNSVGFYGKSQQPVCDE